jgi:DNA-binding transcriptional ArsR family regulator
MLRIHFTLDDLANTRIAASADMGVELVMSLRLLNTGQNDVRFRQWRRELRRRWNPHMALLGELCAPTMQPAFLCEHVKPDHQATTASGAGLDPAYRRDYITCLADFRPVTTFARRLADEDAHARALFGRALGGYQAAAITPFWTQINTLIATHRAEATHTADAGMQRLLGSLHPGIRWKSPILEVDVLRAADIDVHLNGRGLLLQPTVFATTHPAIAGYNTPDHQPALVYPIRRQALLGRHEPDSVRSLIPLLGRTRTAVLSAIIDADLHTTGDIARHIGCSPATVSQHTTVLRDSGLILTRRDGLAVRHTLTDLGITLLSAKS